MLPTDQIENIKQQLISQLDASNLPNASEIKKSILEMNSEQLEQFLIQNKLIKDDSSEQGGRATSRDSSSPLDSSGVGSRDASSASPQIGQPEQCIFCSIVEGKLDSYKIDENKDSIAVLEINPISKAHSLIIPKKHISESSKIPQTSFSLAKKIAKKIKTRFKPKDVIISSSSFMGHEIINVLPVYENETLNSPRNQGNVEELKKLKKQLEKKSKPKQVKKIKTKKIKEQNLWLPKRIP